MRVLALSGLLSLLNRSPILRKPYEISSRLFCSTGSSNIDILQEIEQKYISLSSSTIHSTFQMLSFYHFFNVNDPSTFADNAKFILNSYNWKGTLYVAEEGINGQFAIPINDLVTFHKTIVSFDSMSLYDLDLNLGDVVVIQDHDNNNGDNNNITNQPPFKKLLVKSRPFILTDGFENHSDSDSDSDSSSSSSSSSSSGGKGLVIDVNDAGEEVNPAQWHEEISNSNLISSSSSSSSSSNSNSNDDDTPLLLDCRNHYESDIGRFIGATPLDTVHFSDSWSKLDTLLQDVPKNKRILTYCTGGIRCVKVNAYLRQRHGFTNTGRLMKGVIGYKKWLESTVEDEGHDSNHNNSNPNLNNSSNSSGSSGNSGRDYNRWKKKSVYEGLNYVFDRRRTQMMNVHKVETNDEKLE